MGKCFISPVVKIQISTEDPPTSARKTRNSYWTNVCFCSKFHHLLALDEPKFPKSFQNIAKFSICSLTPLSPIPKVQPSFETLLIVG